MRFYQRGVRVSLLACLLMNGAFATTTHHHHKIITKHITKHTPTHTPKAKVVTLGGFDPALAIPSAQTDPSKSVYIIKNANALLRNSDDPAAGNADGKVTLVEFFDYDCMHCATLSPTVVAAVKTNPDLRIVYKELPAHSAVSLFAAKAALAANKQGKYLQLHNALMQMTKTKLTQNKILQVAKSVGLNIPRLKADMKSAAVAQQLKGNDKLAQALKITKTPILIGAPSSLSPFGQRTGLFFIPGDTDFIYLQDMISKIHA